MSDAENGARRWLEMLSDEDLMFIKRFVLTSGSMKELAKIYGISYPTIRLRLDRLIAKIDVAESEQPMSRFERLLAMKLAEGSIDAETMRQLLKAHREVQGEAS